jgi:glycosyltransferase involved in cell wall biosynthesis
MQEAWMRAQGPHSTRLLSFIERAGAAYDAVFFIGYLYATTYFGLPLVASKAVLVPLAHDEWTLELPLFEGVFRAARTVAFVTPEERDLVLRRFPALANAGKVIGIGIEAPKTVDPRRFRERFGISEPFASYVGRIDHAKGVETLFEYVVQLPEARSMPLVCIGQRYAAVPAHARIRAVGAVDEQTKWDALAACEFIVVPSEFESLSLALLEAWACGKPALVNARSPVLVAQCRRSNGGIAYGSFAEFERAIGAIIVNRVALGSSGRRFVAESYAWGNVALEYLALIDELESGGAGRRP